MPVVVTKVTYDVKHGKDVRIVFHNTYDRCCHPIECGAPHYETLLNQRRNGIGNNLDNPCMFETSYKGKKGNIEEDCPPVQFSENMFHIGNFQGKLVFKELKEKDDANCTPSWQ